MKHVSRVNKLTCLDIILVKQSDNMTFDDDFSTGRKSAVQISCEYLMLANVILIVHWPTRPNLASCRSQNF